MASKLALLSCGISLISAVGAGFRYAALNRQFVEAMPQADHSLFETLKFGALHAQGNAFGVMMLAAAMSVMFAGLARINFTKAKI